MGGGGVHKGLHVDEKIEKNKTAMRTKELVLRASKQQLENEVDAHNWNEFVCTGFKMLSISLYFCF
jgi:hypothetical protein